VGHAYQPRIRVTPLAGPAYVVDISAYRWLIAAQPRYSPIIIRKETINRQVRTTRYGWRCAVVLAFTFSTPSTDEQSLTSLVLDYALDREAKIEISLDGGTTYREVVLADQYEQQNIQGRNVGITLATVWECVEPLERKPAVGSGAW